MANPNDISLFSELARSLTYEEADTNFTVLRDVTTEYNQFVIDQGVLDTAQDAATALVQTNLTTHENATNPHTQYVRNDIRASVKSLDYTMVNLGTSGAINLTDGDYFKMAITTSTAITIANPPTSGKTTTITLYVQNDGGGSLTWPGNVKFSAFGFSPTLGAVYSVYVLKYIDATVGWIGQVFAVE